MEYVVYRGIPLSTSNQKRLIGIRLARTEHFCHHGGLIGEGKKKPGCSYLLIVDVVFRMFVFMPFACMVAVSSCTPASME